MNGRSKNVPTLASLDEIAWTTCCWRAALVRSFSAGFSRFSRIRVYTSARAPFMCCLPLANRQPFHVRQRAAV